MLSYKHQKLLTFLLTDEGHNLWDSQDVRLVVNGETVVIIKMNEYVELDKLNLMADNGTFKDVITKYVVTNHATIDDVNYIFIQEEE